METAVLGIDIQTRDDVGNFRLIDLEFRNRN